MTSRTCTEGLVLGKHNSLMHIFLAAAPCFSQDPDMSRTLPESQTYVSLHTSMRMTAGGQLDTTKCMVNEGSGHSVPNTWTFLPAMLRFPDDLG